MSRRNTMHLARVRAAGPRQPHYLLLRHSQRRIWLRSSLASPSARSPVAVLRRVDRLPTASRYLCDHTLHRRAGILEPLTPPRIQAAADGAELLKASDANGSCWMLCGYVTKTNPSVEEPIRG